MKLDNPGTNLPFSLETFEINPNLLNALKTLHDLAIQYQNKRNTLNKKRTRSRQPRGKFKIQIILKKVFLADILIFTATLMTLIITLVIIYII